MRYVKGILLVAVAVAVCAFAASAQAALPEFGGTVPDEGTTASTGPKFENTTSGLVITCLTQEGTYKVLTVKLTDFDNLYLDCEGVLGSLKLGKCTGLTDLTTGSILTKSTGTLGFKLGGLVPVGTMTPSPEVHISCAAGTLLLLKGCLVGLIVLVKSLKSTLTFNGTGGKQELTDYTNDAGGTVACKLESSTNGGAFAAANLVETESLTLTKELEVKD